MTDEEVVLLGYCFSFARNPKSEHEKGVCSSFAIIDAISRKAQAMLYPFLPQPASYVPCSNTSTPV